MSSFEQWQVSFANEESVDINVSWRGNMKTTSDD